MQRRFSTTAFTSQRYIAGNDWDIGNGSQWKRQCSFLYTFWMFVVFRTYSVNETLWPSWHTAPATRILTTPRRRTEIRFKYFYNILSFACGFFSPLLPCDSSIGTSLNILYNHKISGRSLQDLFNIYNATWDIETMTYIS